MPLPRRLLPFLLVLFFLPQLFSGCFTFRMSQQKLQEHFSDNGVRAELGHYNVSDYTIHYAATGADSLPHVFFFHGAPGSLEAFKGYLVDSLLLQHFRLISVDRPGYGYSNYGRSVVSLKAQSLILRKLLELNESGRPSYLVGHSLGAPVVARLAIDHPELVDGLVLVGASVDPDLEPEEDWFRGPFYTPFLRWILPISFRVTNDEIYFLEEQLREMEPLWKGIEDPVVMVHGGKDFLVPVENVDFVASQLDSSQVHFIIDWEQSHFIPWRKPAMIRDALFHLRDK